MKTTVTALQTATPAEISDRDALTAIVGTLTNVSDATKTAEKLLDTFGSLQAVLEAPADMISKATTPATAKKLATLLPIVRLYQHRAGVQNEQIANRQALESYCKSLLQGKRIEEFWTICVNAQCRIIGARRICSGSIAEVSAYPRLVMEAALAMNAHAVFFTHNHPGATLAPSAADIASTQQLKRALATVDIAILDHCIVAGDSCYSFAAHGDL